MTRYEQGFMNKCAEYGLDAGTAIELMKTAAPVATETSMDRSPGVGPVSPVAAPPTAAATATPPATSSTAYPRANRLRDHLMRSGYMDPGKYTGPFFDLNARRKHDLEVQKYQRYKKLVASGIPSYSARLRVYGI